MKIYKEKNLILLTALALLVTLGTAWLATQPYTFTVTSTYGFKYYGDSLSGIIYASSYTISRSMPFTMTLAPVSVYHSTYGCGGINIPSGFWTDRYKL